MAPQQGPLLLRRRSLGNRRPITVLIRTGVQRWSAHVPAGHWQRAEPADDAEVLLACLVTPGFDFADFTLLGADDQA